MHAISCAFLQVKSRVFPRRKPRMDQSGGVGGRVFYYDYYNPIGARREHNRASLCSEQPIAAAFPAPKPSPSYFALSSLWLGFWTQGGIEESPPEPPLPACQGSSQAGRIPPTPRLPTPPPAPPTGQEASAACSHRRPLPFLLSRNPTAFLSWIAVSLIPCLLPSCWRNDRLTLPRLRPSRCTKRRRVAGAAQGKCGEGACTPPHRGSCCGVGG